MLPAHIVGDVSSIRLSAFLFVIGIVLVVFVVVIVSSVVVVFIVVVVIIVLKCGSLKSWRKTCPLFCCQFLRIAGGFKILLGFSLERGMGGADLDRNTGNTKNLFNNLLFNKT